MHQRGSLAERISPVERSVKCCTALDVLHDAVLMYESSTSPLRTEMQTVGDDASAMLVAAPEDWTVASDPRAVVPAGWIAGVVTGVSAGREACRDHEGEETAAPSRG